jgi:hypothetical protein
VANCCCCFVECLLQVISPHEVMGVVEVMYTWLLWLSAAAAAAVERLQVISPHEVMGLVQCAAWPPAVSHCCCCCCSLCDACLQVISPHEVMGVVEVVEHLSTVQDKVYEEATVLVVHNVTGGHQLDAADACSWVGPGACGGPAAPIHRSS